jgi:hypothetical protein
MVADITGWTGQVNSHTVTRSDNVAAFRPLNGTQVTESENHPSWRTRVKGRFQGDIGGPFDMRKSYAEGSPLTSALDYVLIDQQNKRTLTGRYVGPFLPAAPSLLAFPASAQSSESSLNALGTKAIALCSPSSPAASLANFGVELIQDGLPSLAGGTLQYWSGLSPTGRRKAIGDQYLNYQFGWVPFANDLKRLSRSIVDGQRIFDDYEANSGSVVRRKFSFPPVKEDEWADYLVNRPAWVSPSVGELSLAPPYTGKVVRHTETYKLQWFSGGFTYYVPPRDGSLRTDMARAVIKARHLLGLSLTPDVIWESSPWSWALDWFGNAGSLITNWTNWAIDNQVLKYGYMMEHTLRRNTYTFVGPTGFVRKDVRPFDVSTVFETKVRRKATPYGFGLSWDGFSARQLAIIAALGISRF